MSLDFSKASVLERLSRGPEARRIFVDSHVNKGIASQIRAMRARYELSQADLGERSGMNQNAISRLESADYGKATISTLKRIAAAFDVGLVVRFVPFSKLADWVSSTPYLEEGLSMESLAVSGYDTEQSETLRITSDVQQTPRPGYSSRRARRTRNRTRFHPGAGTLDLAAQTVEVSWRH